jgi:hypothetical protein
MTRVRLMARAVTAKLARIARRLNARASAPPKATWSAYVPTPPTSPTPKMRCPCDCEHNRKMGCSRRSTNNFS